MQRIVVYPNGMYLNLPKISSEIQIFNFGCLSSGHSKRMCGSMFTLWNQKGPGSKKVWETSEYMLQYL